MILFFAVKEKELFSETPRSDSSEDKVDLILVLSARVLGLG
jgi:hypothetical protein